MSPESGFSSVPFSKLSLVYANSKDLQNVTDCSFAVKTSPDLQDIKKIESARDVY